MTVIDKPRLDRAHVLELLRGMIRIRRFEDKCAELYTRQKIRGFLHLYDGEEAIAAGVIPVLGPQDRVVATYREHGHALLRGVPMTKLMAEMYGKAAGCSGGRGGSMHLFDADTNFSIWAWGTDDRDLIVNEIGPYEGTVRVPSGLFVWDITGNGGNWTIDCG